MKSVPMMRSAWRATRPRIVWKRKIVWTARGKVYWDWDAQGFIGNIPMHRYATRYLRRHARGRS